jgi:GT2 family glycosyltransferase
MGAPASSPSLTLCICTVDRVDILRRCLESILKGSEQPEAVLVSDDSADGTEAAMVCREFEGVTYIQGPRRGLCANRNWVIRHATTTHVSLLDDDAMVSQSFVRDAKALISECADNVIITGIVDEAESQLIPFNPSFLGHFSKPPKDRFENVNLNCNVFPRRAFEHASFDEAIVFGYEDMDICSHLLFLGFQIRFESRLQNTHLPPKKTSSRLKTQFIRTERARFYTSVKRYMLWNRNYFVLMAYLLIAPAHRALHAVKAGFWFDLKNCIPDMVAAVQDALREKAKLRQLKVRPNHASRPSGA